MLLVHPSQLRRATAQKHIDVHDRPELALALKALLSLYQIPACWSCSVTPEPTSGQSVCRTRP
jgi:hypothetical protein